MRILQIQAAIDSGGGNFRDIATFDIELTEEVRLCRLRLVKAPDGNHLIYGPVAAGKRCMTFHPTIARKITELAVQALGDCKVDENRQYA